MLINFICSNFLSIDDQIRFSLFKSPTRSLSNHIFSAGNKQPQMVKSAIIYGANAAGKTSLVKAIDSAATYILKGAGNEEFIDIPKFRLNKEEKDSSLFEFTFFIKDNYYSFGFEINSSKVLDEWCYKIRNKKTELIYGMKKGEEDSRVYDFGRVIGKNNEEREFMQFSAKATLDNQLILTTLSKSPQQNLHYDIKNVINWFRSLKVVYPSTKIFNPLPVINNDNFLTDFAKILQDLGIDINGFNNIPIASDRFEEYASKAILEDIKKRMKQNTTSIIRISNQDYFTIALKDGKIEVNKLVLCRKSCANNEVKFDLSEESDGTRRLLDLVPMLIDMKENNAIYIVDEIDRSFHTLLTKKLFEMFFKITEGRACQLIATTHDTNLMDLEQFRDDEIWYVRKNDNKASEFYCLYQFKQRFDKKIIKDYLNGRFEAIPIFHESID